jgi:hypothetical protein
MNGIATGLGVFAIAWLVVRLRTKRTSLDFDAQGEKGAFEKLLSVYLRLAEFVLGLAAGSIVLLVGSSAFRASGRLPGAFASPLFLLSMSIVYGVLFSVFLTDDYETYRHRPGGLSYTRFRYTKNRALGFGSLICFCVGYIWLVVIVTK